MIPFVAPNDGLQAFNCPHCYAYARQHWYDAYGVAVADLPNGRPPGVRFSLCAHCQEWCVWRGGEMLDPRTTSGVPQPSPDLSPEVEREYREAAEVVSTSPRAAAALLRLALQKLCRELEPDERDLSNAIGALVRRGLSPSIQRAADYVRFIGNEAVHPGRIDMSDNRDTAITLFQLINLIAEGMISAPRRVDELFDSMPEGVRDAIQRRDAPPRTE